MKSVRNSVLASAVGLALFGVGASTGVSATGPAQLQATAGATTQKTSGRYIVTFAEAGLANYQGDVSGLQRTAPELDLVSAHSSRKLDARSTAAVAYKYYLASQRSLHIGAIEQQLGRALSIRYTYDVTRNGISAAMSPSEAAAISRLPGVTSVSAVGYKDANTFRGPTFIGANTIWDGTQVPSYATASRGQGEKVGVIDTGTNIGHPSFANDPACGFSEASPKLFPRDCNANNGTICTGTDFNADGGYDGQGHGVHTSSTAAGNTIDNTATPAPLLPDGVSMSGVAPCASVYSYKVADSAGGIADDAIAAAIANAIVDQVDVVNFSIGPTCGGGNPWDDSLDFLTAEGADVFVAASAGNTRSTCTVPTGLVANNGPWMLTVAASSQDQIAAPVLTATGPGTVPPAAQNIALIAGSTTTPVASTFDFSGMSLRTYPTNITGCTATGGFPAGYFTSAVAIIQRGTCSFTEKITNAYNSGAQVVVITNNQAGSISMDTTGAPAGVAAFSTYKAPGDALIAFVNANLGPIPAADAVFSDGFEIPAGAIGDYHKIGIGQVPGDILAKFSFRGPTQAPYDNLTKPDITGPGVNIYAAFDTPSGSYSLLSGTSMSSPHLAGAAALVRAIQPTWSVMEVKSALQTTATLAGLEQDEVTPWNVDDVGSGRVDLTKATRAGLTLDETNANFVAANPTGGSIDQKALNLASLRNVSCAGACTWTRTFKNRLHASGTWTPTAVDPTGYHLTFSPAVFTLAQDATQVVTITATPTGTPAAVIAFGRVDLHESASQSPDQHLTVAVKPAPPAGPVIAVAPASLTSTQAAGTSMTAPLTVSNTGGGTLTWNFTTTGALTVWNQPKNLTGGIVSDFSIADNGGGFTAADFAVTGGSKDITKITTFGFDNTSSLLAQPKITFRIYSDAAGLPSGNPDTGTGTPVWTYDSAPNGAGVTVAGTGDITLDLVAAGQTLNLPVGTYWLTVFPTYTGAIGPAGSARWNWSQALLQAGPGVLTGNEFGVANWTALQGLVNWPDVAFNIQGAIPCGAPWLSFAPTSGSDVGGANTPIVATFNSTGLAVGTYTANACIASNDAATSLVVVPVTLTVTAATPTCTPAQLFQDPGFEATSPADYSNAFWASTSTNGGTSLCDANCGASAMHAGAFWTWFGGWGTSAETGTVSQSVVIPTGSDRWVNFYLLRSATTTNATLTLNVDGTTIATYPHVTTTEPAYVLRSMQVPATYIDGNSHTIELKFVKTGAGNMGNMHVDDVTLDCAQGTAAPQSSTPVAEALRALR